MRSLNVSDSSANLSDDSMVFMNFQRINILRNKPVCIDSQAMAKLRTISTFHSTGVSNDKTKSLLGINILYLLRLQLAIDNVVLYANALLNLNLLTTVWPKDVSMLDVLECLRDKCHGTCEQKL